MSKLDRRLTWLPRMLEELLKTWSWEISWGALGAFCLEMQEARKVILAAFGFPEYELWCPNCHATAPYGDRDVTIRSALFALEKSGIITMVELEGLDKKWKAFRRKNDLDAHAKPRDKSRRNYREYCNGHPHGRNP